MNVKIFCMPPLRKATLKLQRPIDRIEVTSDKILFWAGKVKLAITYTYVQAI